MLEKLGVPADVTDGKWMIAQSNSKAVKLLLRNIEKDFKNYNIVYWNWNTYRWSNWNK